MFHDDEDLTLDLHLDYSDIEGLSSEVKERLDRVRPTSIVCLFIRSELSDQVIFVLGCCQKNGRYDARECCCLVQVREKNEGFGMIDTYSISCEYTAINIVRVTFVL